MESISVFDMIKIGIGPSSSHTMGPWKSMFYFIETLLLNDILASTKRVEIELYGSLAKTGKGHGTDIAVVLGLCGVDYRTVSPEIMQDVLQKVKTNRALSINNTTPISFDWEKDIIFNMNQSLPFHPNGLCVRAFSATTLLKEKTYFSVGGGFVVEEHGLLESTQRTPSHYPCHTAADIYNYCEQLNWSVSELVAYNESSWRTRKEIEDTCMELWDCMVSSIYRGVYRSGVLPGGLQVQRRASLLNQQLLKHNKQLATQEAWMEEVKKCSPTFQNVNKWIACFALAVNEENASYGRIVTAPTNGAAGVVPAVLMYAYCFLEGIGSAQIIQYLLVAGEIGTLYKKKATISAAMGGCQAEIGVSSSMAAAALTELLGGTPAQVLMAAEIAMEHHLGMTCDPIGGLVQIPCIERNAMGAIKAITAANIAMESNPKDACVSLDSVIQSMWETALDMNKKYKETSEGGLANQISVNVAEC